MSHLYNKDDCEDEALGQYIGKEGESITYIHTYNTYKHIICGMTVHSCLEYDSFTFFLMK